MTATALTRCELAHIAKNSVLAQRKQPGISAGLPPRASLTPYSWIMLMKDSWELEGLS